MTDYTPNGYPKPTGSDPIMVAEDVAALAVHSDIREAVIKQGAVDSAGVYTDQKVVDVTAVANSYADTGDTDTLASASSYADTQDTAKLTEAKLYADGGDTATLTSANAYTDAQKFMRSFISNTLNLNDVTTAGVHPAISIPSDWAAKNYPFNTIGSVTVEPLTTNGSSILQIYKTREAVPRIAIRSLIGGTWSAWREIDAAEAPVTLVSASTDLNTLPAPTRPAEHYATTGLAADWAGQHYPDNTYGHITRLRLTNAWFIEVFREFAPRQRCFTRHVVGTAYQPWVNHDPDRTKVDAGVGALGIRHHMLTDDLYAYYGGPIGTDGAAPVALTWDDYPREFRDSVLPLLEARGLPFTIGLSSRQYDPAAATAGGTWQTVYEGAQGTTFPEIDEWTVNRRGEVAAHGATHGGTSTQSGLFAEIGQGALDLRAALPSKPIFCWIQPSATYDAGFNNGDSIDAYATTMAGKYILDYHAMATGVRTVNGLNRVPRRGKPIQGLTRSWISSTAGINGTKNSIQAATNAKHGIVVGSHANDLSDGRITLQELTDFLDWIVAEQNAGRIKVMKLSEWAIADTSLPV